MKNRANLQYSIYFDELGEELCRLMQKSTRSAVNASKAMRPLLKKIEADPDYILTSDVADKLTDIRTDIVNADYLLNDLERLISSYLSYKFEQATNAAQESPEAPAPPASFPSGPFGTSPPLQEVLEQLRDTAAAGSTAPEDPALIEELSQKLQSFANAQKT
jgi:hypothetical protein